MGTNELFNQNYNSYAYSAIVLALVGMALWSHYVAIKTDPGHLPHKPKAVIKKAEKEKEKEKLAKDGDKP